MNRRLIYRIVLALLFMQPTVHLLAQPGDAKKAGWAYQLKSRFRTKATQECPPFTLFDIAQKLDVLEEGILDDGTVVMKQPDIWGQGRMTLFRLEFEKEMGSELEHFAPILSARISRTDQASFESATAVGTALAGQARGPLLGTQVTVAPDKTSDANTVALLKNQNDALHSYNADALSLLKEQISERDKFLELTIGLLAGKDDATITRNTTFNNLPAGKPFQNISLGASSDKLGLEPTVVLDEKKRYLDHLHEIRRVNLGDDNADRSGYGLYLVRMPISIQPGEKSQRGHGAQIDVTARPDFGPLFLQDTFRNLVVADLVDLLAPVLFELMERNTDEALTSILTRIRDARMKALEKRREFLEKRNKALKKREEYQQHLKRLELIQDATPPQLVPPSPSTIGTPISPTDVGNQLLNAIEQAQDAATEAEIEARKAEIEADKITQESESKKPFIIAINYSRIDRRPYPIAPNNLDKVFFIEKLIGLALNARSSMTVYPVRAMDVRSYLEQELSDAYDALGRVQNLMEIAEPVAYSIENRNFSALWPQFKTFVARLPGDLEDNTADPTAILAWACMIDATLLDRRLKEEMIRLEGQRNFQVSCDLQSMCFYLPNPDPIATETFAAFVNARWPMITFAIDPVVDQQNIADAFSLRRDMQVALALAFSSGRINFNQFNRFRRRLELDAETISLNRTVTSFAHGNETFGWRFSPRYQTPVEESNLKAFSNLVFHGGPTQDSQLNSRMLEAGQRELTVILLMPSFLQRVRFDVTGNWFKLANPDDLKVSTSRMLWLGQQLMELRHATTQLCDQSCYRAGDLQRVLTRIDKLEAALPMQTEFVQVPYENMQSGFELFSPGGASLAPELFGFTGLNDIHKGKDASFLLYGKNINIQQTEVVAGGRFLPKENIQILSRQVMRVVVPFEVLTTTKSTSPGDYVELHIATSNGISNRLMIPYKGDPPAIPASPPNVISNFKWEPAPTPEFELNINSNGTRSVFPSGDTATESYTISTVNDFEIPQRVVRFKMFITISSKGSQQPVATRTYVLQDAEGGVFGPSGSTTITAEAINDRLKDALLNHVAATIFAKDGKPVTATVETFVQIDASTIPVKLDNRFTMKITPVFNLTSP